MMEWDGEVGYEGKQPVAYIYPSKGNMRHVVIKVMGGKPEDNYFVCNTIQPAHSQMFSGEHMFREGVKIAEATRRIIKDQPNQDVAQAAIRAYARIKGEHWWDEK